MKTIKIRNILSAVMALIMTVGIFATVSPLTASAAETYERGFQHLDFSDSAGYVVQAGQDYDGIASMYNNILFYLDIDYLVENFSEDLSKLKEYTLEMKVAAYCQRKLDQSNYSSIKYYGMGESTSGGAVESDYYNGDIIAKNNTYKTLLTHSNYKDNTPLPVMKNGDIVFSWNQTTKGVEGVDYNYFLDVRIKGNSNGSKGTYDVEKEWRFFINTYSSRNTSIEGFDAPVHGKAFDTEVTCDIGECVSIKYYSYDDLMNNGKFTEVTKAVAGERGVVEFTIVKPHTDFEMYLSGINTYNDNLNRDVTSRLNISNYTGIMNSAGGSPVRWWEDSDTVIDVDAPECKYYAIYTVSDNDNYVIKQGTISLTAPEDGATADSKVTLSNIKKIPKRVNRFTFEYPQFTAEDAVWLTVGKGNKMTVVKSFSAGKSYIAIVKLKPYGDYYFNDDSVEALSVPGASSFKIQYIKAGSDAYIKEDGWYLTAIFPKVTAKYCDININYEKSEMTVPQNSASYLTALSSVELSGATDVEVKWYWSKDITKDNVGEVCSVSNGDLKLQLDTSTVGTSYYKCVISCKMDGLESRIQYPSTEWVKVTVTEKASNPLTLSAVGKQSVSVTEKGQSVTFEVTAKNTSGTVKYTWYACDASGNSVDDVVIGTDKKLVVSGIDGGYGDIYYYKCVASDSKGSDSLIFVATVLYETEITLPTDSQSDTSTPDSSKPDDTNVPETSEPDVSRNDSTDSDASDTDSSKPGQSNPSDIGKEDGGMSIWLIIVIIVAILAVVATVVIIVVKKKKANEVK